PPCQFVREIVSGSTVSVPVAPKLSGSASCRERTLVPDSVQMPACVIVLPAGTLKTTWAPDRTEPQLADAHVTDRRSSPPPETCADPDPFGAELCRDTSRATATPPFSDGSKKALVSAIIPPGASTRGYTASG